MLLEAWVRHRHRRNEARSVRPAGPERSEQRMYALFQVEGKGAAQKIETDLQAYVKRLKYEGFTNKLTAAGNGVHEAMNTIYLVFWMKDEETPPVVPDARPRGMAARASALVQSTLSGFLS